MHTLRTIQLFVLLALTAVPLAAQGTKDSKAKDARKPTPTPTVSTGGTIPTASEGSTAMAVRGRPQPGRARTVDVTTGIVTGQTDDQHWTVKLRVTDRATLGLIRPGDAMSFDLLAQRGTIGGQAFPIANLTSEIRLTARYQMEQVCAKRQADLNAAAEVETAAGNYSPRWRCTVQEFPGSQPPMYTCMCLPIP